MNLEYIAIILAVLLIVLAVIYRRLTSTFDYFEKRGIHGPKPIPLFGNWWGIWNKFQGEHDLNNARAYGKVYGTFDGKTPNLIVTDSNVVKALLGKESGSFRNRRAQCVKSHLLQQSLLAISNNEKQNQNKALPSFLVHEKIRSLVPLFLKGAESLRQNIEQSTKEEEGSVNISKHVGTYLADSLALGVFGLDLNKTEDLKKHFLKFCDQAFLNTSPESVFSLIPFLYPSTKSLDGFVMGQAGITFFASLCQSTINERRSSEKDSPNQVRDIIELYLEAAEEEKQLLAKQKSAVEELPTLNDERLIAECLAVILNTSVLTRNLVALSLHTLATKSDIQETLFSEMTKNLQSEHSISYEVIHGSKYLNMFMDEIARFYPSEFRLERICIDTMEVENYKIDQGTVISIPLYALHHSEAFYSDPEEFNPERFSPENVETRNPSSYLPYGQLGSNTGNINVQFGVLAAKTAVAYLVKNLKFSTTKETQIPPQFVNGLTGVLRARDIHVQVESRN